MLSVKCHFFLKAIVFFELFKAISFSIILTFQISASSIVWSQWLKLKRNLWTQWYGYIVWKDYFMVFIASWFPLHVTSFPNLMIVWKGVPLTQGITIIKKFQYKKLLLQTPQNTRSNLKHCGHWEKRKLISQTNQI